MNVFEKIVNYCSTGSVEQQNKRRLGALLIGITSILLVLSMLALVIGGVVQIAQNFDWGKKPNNGDDTPTTNSHLVAADLNAVMAAPQSTIILDGATATALGLSDSTVITKNRPKDANGNLIYGCENKDNYHLQLEASLAFNAMMQKFYDESGLRDVYVAKAYNKHSDAIESNTGYYKNALAVKLDRYDTETLKNLGTTYNTTVGETEDAYGWIYENAHKYGFVRASGNEGEENIFTYVGLAHSKAIYDKQKKSDESFYTVSDYVAEIKATTVNSKKDSRGYKKAGEDSTMTYYSYYMASDSAEFKLPSNKYDYTVTTTEENGYIVTYWRKTN